MNPFFVHLFVFVGIHFFQNRQRRPEKIVINEYESIVAGDIIPPEKLSVTFNDIGGLEDIKQRLQESIILPLRHPEIFARGKLLTVPKGRFYILLLMCRNSPLWSSWYVVTNSSMFLLLH